MGDERQILFVFFRKEVFFSIRWFGGGGGQALASGRRLARFHLSYVRINGARPDRFGEKRKKRKLANKTAASVGRRGGRRRFAAGTGQRWRADRLFQQRLLPRRRRQVHLAAVTCPQSFYFNKTKATNDLVLYEWAPNFHFWLGWSRDFLFSLWLIGFFFIEEFSVLCLPGLPISSKVKAGVGTGEGDGDEDELLDESRNGSSMAARTFVTSNCPTKKKGKSVLKSQFQCIC